MRTNELILYKNMEEGQLLQDMVFLMEEYQNDYYNREDILSLLSDTVNRILELSVSHGFEGNLWQDYLTYLLAPATVSLAIPMYERMQLLKENYAAILTGILSGVLASLVCVLAMALVFHLSQAEYVTLLPKSVTTAIGMDIAKELGGHSEIAAAVIIITGVLGNMAAEPICRIFAIRHPVAKGIALGTSAHAIGTAKAMEMGETEGAMSSLAIVVAGVCTVVGATVFAGLL